MNETEQNERTDELFKYMGGSGESGIACGIALAGSFIKDGLMAIADALRERRDPYTQ